MIMSKRLYVAYGSNLNFKQMKHRCPTAKLYGIGTVYGYELQFKGSPASAFATIMPKEDASVPVAVWKIQPRDEVSLDRYEGYPSHYFKQDISVRLDGEEVTGMVYIMNPKMDFGLPSPYYYQTVHEGYENCGMDTDVLDAAVMNSARQYYEEQFHRGQQQTLFDISGEDDEEEELLQDEPDENNPFSFSGQMHL